MKTLKKIGLTLALLMAVSQAEAGFWGTFFEKIKNFGSQYWKQTAIVAATVGVAGSIGIRKLIKDLEFKNHKCLTSFDETKAAFDEILNEKKLNAGLNKNTDWNTRDNRCETSGAVYILDSNTKKNDQKYHFEAVLGQLGESDKKQKVKTFSDIMQNIKNGYEVYINSSYFEDPITRYKLRKVRNAWMNKKKEYLALKKT